MSASRTGKAALGAGVALAGSYALTVARFRRQTRPGFDLDNPPAPASPEFARLVEAVTGSPVRPGNRVRILRNGDETLSSMLEAVYSAAKTIDFSSYIYWPGDITETFTAAFIERAHAGVEVNVLLDGYGSAKLDGAHVAHLRREGVNVAFFRPPRWHDIEKMNNRMHRRLLIVDGRVGFAGGVGIADVWTGNAQDPLHWRETHVRLEGPAVRDIFGGFAENWTATTHALLAGAHTPHLPRIRDGVEAHVTRSTPNTSVTSAAGLFHVSIAGAQERLWLTTAYFTAGQAFMDALCHSAKRGVDVRLLLNGPHIDKAIVRRSSQRSFGALLEAGVRIFEYQPTMLHAKTMVIDQGWAHVGSSNFDHRSFALDAELIVSVTDPGLVNELADHFQEDLEDAEEIHLAAWRRRSLPKRAAELAGDLGRQSY